MPLGANPNYYNPQVGQIVSNLATAIYGDPEARAKAGYYGAETNNANAAAGKTGEETRGLRMKNDATAGLPTALGKLFVGPGTPAENFKNNITSAATIMTSGGGTADNQAGALKSLFSTAYGLGDNNDMTRSVILDGKTPDQNFAPSVGRADQVADRNFKAEKAKSDSTANIQNAGAMARTFAAPVVVRPGENVNLSPNDPRRATMGDTLYGDQTLDQVRAGAGTKILGLPDGEAPNPNLANVFSGGAGYKGATAKPKNVSGKTLDDAVMAGASLLPGAVTRGSNNKISLDANFENSFPPEKIVAARNAAGAELERSGNVQSAGQAYINALGVQSGDTWSTPHGSIASIFSGPGGLQHAQAPAAPEAAAAPAGVITDKTQLPPPEQRKVGMTITTPKGDMTWNGAGWVPAGAVH